MVERYAEWITVREAATLLGADVETVRFYIKRGVLTGVRIGEPRPRVHVLRSEVERVLRRQPGEPSRAEDTVYSGA